MDVWFFCKDRLVCRCCERAPLTEWNEERNWIGVLL